MMASRESAFATIFLFLSFATSSLDETSSRSGVEHPATSARFDGPAELPRIYMKSALADTPAPGQVRLVREGENLQEAINSAKCGDTLNLQAASTFRGLFRFPQKSCDDSHWIILRTSAPDDSLPAEGTRITPCYGGLASLPARPDFHCALVRNVMAKIEFDRNGGSGPILFLSGANHYRFIGLEITRALPEKHLRHLIQPEKPETTAHHLVFDRLWLHGTAQDETKGGIHLSGTTYVAVVDSYFSDFHCIAMKGSCTDAQAVNGGGGDAPGGPYKILNNVLEASGENILCGGAPGTTTPTEIEIRRNHLCKPMIWKSSQPDFVGAYTGNPYIVKNHFELKNAQRVLFEGNVLENVWGGFTQTGFSILLTPVNQGNKCPLCRVTDVTIRYNKINHVAGALQIATALNNFGTAASAGERYSIHDLLVDDIDGDAYKGFGNFVTVVSVTPPIKDVRIDHVTAFPPRALMTILSPADRPKLENFTITNNIFTAGVRQIASAGDRYNCGYGLGGNDPAAMWNSCLADSTFTHNMIIGGKGKWPSTNILAKDTYAAGIPDSRSGGRHDYRVCREKREATGCKAASPGLRAGTDGKDIGADIDAIENATAGVI